MAKYKIMSNNTTTVSATVADLKTMQFRAVTVDVIDAPNDPEKLADRVRKIVNGEGVALARIDNVEANTGIYRLRTDLFIALAEYAEDNKNFAKNPLAEELAAKLGLPELKTRKRGEPDEDPDEMTE